MAGWLACVFDPPHEPINTHTTQRHWARWCTGTITSGRSRSPTTASWWRRSVGRSKAAAMHSPTYLEQRVLSHHHHHHIPTPTDTAPNRKQRLDQRQRHDDGPAAAAPDRVAPAGQARADAGGRARGDPDVRADGVGLGTGGHGRCMCVCAAFVRGTNVLWCILV